MLFLDDTGEKDEFISRVLTAIKLIDGKSYRVNEKFDWIYAVHKLRELGLNSQFLFGLYVNPRSETDKRNILEVYLTNFTITKILFRLSINLFNLFSTCRFANHF